MIPSPPSEQAEPHAQAPGRPRDEPCVLLKLGEIVLKGRNRQHFGRILHDNLRAALRDTGIPVDMRQRDGVILLRVADGASRGPDGLGGRPRASSPSGPGTSRASSRWPARSGWPRRPRRSSPRRWR